VECVPDDRGPLSQAIVRQLRLAQEWDVGWELASLSRHAAKRSLCHRIVLPTATIPFGSGASLQEKDYQTALGENRQGEK